MFCFFLKSEFTSKRKINKNGIRFVTKINTDYEQKNSTSKPFFFEKNNNKNQNNANNINQNIRILKKSNNSNNNNIKIKFNMLIYFWNNS